MRHWKRLLYYLLINIFVSACTVLVVLALWERMQPQGLLLGTRAGPGLQLTRPALAGQGSFPTEALTTGPGEPGSVATNQVVTPASPQEQEYRVQPGDTLGAIAVRFQIDMELLMEANGITDPNRLEVGQMLVIPTPVQEPEPSATPETPEPTDTPRLATNTPPPVTGDPQVVIESVVGAGDLETERVLLKRIGAGELSLAGWKLVEGGGAVYTFPQLVLFEGGAVNLHTRSGQETVVDLYWGLGVAVWESGELVQLMDENGEVHSTLQVP
ncbi:MAG TPA: LysM peptidoglycan-binding domain-containing protein [Anaerolineales bacterium]|nr:LysM peptidoglycan-binding domain-containing protein [Anaerolineales bacterium]